MWLNHKQSFQQAVNLIQLNEDGSSEFILETTDSSSSDNVKNVSYIEQFNSPLENTCDDEFWLKGDDFDALELAIDNDKVNLSDINAIYVFISHFTNGRAFSLANQLRADFAFNGKIWGVGSIIPDQYSYVLSCGFDGIKLPPKHPEAAPFIDNLNEINIAYQQPNYLENKKKAANSHPSTQEDLSYQTILQRRHNA